MWNKDLQRHTNQNQDPFLLQEEKDIFLLSILFHCVCVDVMKGYSSHHHHCVMDEMQTQNARCENVINVWLLAWRKLGAKGQGWADGPMLRSRFKRSSLRTPLAAIAAPGGTMGGSEVSYSSKTADLALTLRWPDCVQLFSGRGFLIAPSINLQEEKGGVRWGLLRSGRKQEWNY